jgi:hypothetical protein
MLGAHDHLHRGHARAPAQSTVVSVVYVTASKTFTGAVGGYTTLGVAIDTDTSSTTTAAKTSTAPSPEIIADTTSTKATKSQTTLATSTLPSSITSSLSSAPTSILAATSSLSVVATSLRTSSSASAAISTASADSSSGGMSTAGKAGLAIGILLLVAAVLAMVLFCFKRRREAAGHKLENEKHEFTAVSPAAMSRHNSTATNATTRTQATAPRLSLRPVTQFLPNLVERRASKGNALNVGNDGWQKPQVNQAENKDNPFGNHAETIDSTNAAGPGLVKGVTPAGDVVLVDPLENAPPALKRGASKRDVGSKTLDFTKAGPFMGPPSPAGTEFSMSSEAGTPVQTATSAAIAAAGGPATSAVHRVQLDFLPSMGDELGLKAGQLVRVLHEFDDGWVSLKSDLY